MITTFQKITGTPLLGLAKSIYYSIPLPKPLQPAPYVPPQPVLKQRTKRQAPIPLLRKKVLKKVMEKVKKIQKLIDEIAPYYEPSTISENKKNLKFIKEAEIIKKKKALKN